MKRASLADLEAERARLLALVAELEKEQAAADADPRRIVRVVAELADARAALPAVERRIASAQKADADERAAADAAAVAALWPVEKRQLAALVAAVGVVEAALSDLEKTRAEIAAHRGMAKGVLPAVLRPAVLQARATWRMAGTDIDAGGSLRHVDVTVGPARAVAPVPDRWS